MSKRRLNKEGSISFNTAKGLWVATITDDGKRLFRYGATKKAVVEKLKTLKRKQDSGTQLVDSGMLIKDYLPSWLELVKPSIRFKTYNAYEGIVRTHLIPRLGNIRLNKLTTERINKTWSEMLKEGYSATLIEHCHLRLSTALVGAIKRKLIANNPIQFVTKPKVEKNEIRPLSNTPEEQEYLDENGQKQTRWVSEIDRLLEVATGTQYYSLIYTALHTGMRRNELLGLMWKDVNLDEAVLHVNRSIHRVGGKTTYLPPKTNAGRRSVSLTPSSAIQLRWLLLKQRVDAKTYGYEVTENSPVFIRTTGQMLLPDAVTHAFKKMVKSIDINDVWFHDLRHTHATVMLIQGVHPKVVQERLGHEKISTTLDLYSHVIKSMQTDAVLKFDEAVAPRIKELISN